MNKPSLTRQVRGWGVVLLCSGLSVALPSACTAEPTPPGNRILPTSGAPPGASPANERFGLDLPCEAAEVLQAHCSICHAGSGAYPPLLETHADLVAPSAQPGLSVAEVSLRTMRGEIDPMPPSVLLPESSFDAFAQWVAAGLPTGECATLAPPVGAEPVCTSATYRTGGDDDEEDMYPGGTCVSCHQREGDPEEAPLYAFAGTVYPSVREPDGCVGAGNAFVTLSDALGRTWQVPTRPGSGNFMVSWPAADIAYPVTASVSVGAETLTMKQPIASASDGDCNRCHSQDGAEGAPGRIFTP